MLLLLWNQERQIPSPFLFSVIEKEKNQAYEIRAEIYTMQYGMTFFQDFLEGAEIESDRYLNFVIYSILFFSRSHDLFLKTLAENLGCQPALLVFNEEWEIMAVYFTDSCILLFLVRFGDANLVWFACHLFLSHNLRTAYIMGTFLF